MTWSTGKLSARMARIAPTTLVWWLRRHPCKLYNASNLQSPGSAGRHSVLTGIATPNKASSANCFRGHSVGGRAASQSPLLFRVGQATDLREQKYWAIQGDPRQSELEASSNSDHSFHAKQRHRYMASSTVGIRGPVGPCNHPSERPQGQPSTPPT